MGSKGIRYWDLRKQKNSEWIPLLCLADVGDAEAAATEEFEKEKLMKQTILSCHNQDEGFNHKVSKAIYKKQKLVSTLREYCKTTDEEDSNTDTLTTALSEKQSGKGKKPIEEDNSLGNFRPDPDHEPEPHPPGLPKRFKAKIKEMEGTDEKLIIQKPLSKTDCSKSHGRLSIPVNQVKVEFLTDEEKKSMRGRKGLEVKVIEPSLRTKNVALKIWDMEKSSGKSSSIYVLLREWNSMRNNNPLKVDDEIQLWSFRVNSKLCLALVNYTLERRKER